MFLVFIQKDLKLMCSNWSNAVFSLLLYGMLLLSIFMIIPNIIVDEKIEYLVYFLSIISFLSQAIFINLAQNQDYTANIISYFYKLNGSLFMFVAAKFCVITITFIAHSVLLFAVLWCFTDMLLTSVICIVIALFLYTLIINLMLIFANNLMISNANGYYALLILPFTIPYIMITISAATAPQYLTLFLGLILIKIPIIVGLVSLCLTRDVCE